MIRYLLLGILYIFICCFVVLMILVYKAPEYIETEDGTLIPKPEVSQGSQKAIP